MKKRMIAVLMTVMLCTACGKKPVEAEPFPSNPSEPTQSEPTAVFDQKTVEERIKEIGESYDGLYSYDDTDMGIMNFATTAGVMAESCDATATEPSVAGGTYIPDLPDIVPDGDWNTENYNNINENGFVAVSSAPFSTFGADVDTATYSNLRRSLYENDGYGITDNAIRIEEMVNYFHYDYPNADSNKFSVIADVAPCPWNKDTMVLRIGVKAQELQADKGSNIVFLIDTSGSMFSNNKLPLAQEAFKMLQEQLTDKDTVSIVTYAGNEEVVLEGAKGTDHDKIVDAIDGLEAWGSTNGEGGINKAYEIAEKYFIEGGNNRVILATDGDLNVGVSSEAGLIKLVEEKKETGVFLSCLGFGEGNYQDDKMEALADHGNGNYAFVDCTREAERVLKDEIWSTLYTVAKDVKFQVEFNPAQVKAYRQIGYENRAMSAEDFADDTKDGGEVGSGQTVTVLYELVLKDSAMEIDEPASRYSGNEESVIESDELLAVNIRYKEPNENDSKLIVQPVTPDMVKDSMDDDMSWAVGVAQFGMVMRDSQYKGNSTFDTVYNRLISNPAVMTDDFKAEFLYLIQLANDQSNQ